MNTQLEDIIHANIMVVEAIDQPDDMDDDVKQEFKILEQITRLEYLCAINRQ